MITLQCGERGADGVNTRGTTSAGEVDQVMFPGISDSDEVRVLSSNGIYNPFGENVTHARLKNSMM